METIVLFSILALLLAIGVPIAIALGLSSLTMMIFFSDSSLASIALKFFEGSEKYTLLAIPFFILASTFLSTGGVARRIINFAISSVGHLQGGLAIAGVFACMLFAAISGSSPATVIAIGSIVIAGMVKVGYSKEFAAGVICNAGTLGILIPPSIVMVVYAAATDVSVGRMFLAGIIPGIVAGLMLMIAIYIVARKKNFPKHPFAGFDTLFQHFREAFWGLFLVVIILGSIYSGIVTPTEAAAVAAVYSFCIALFVYKDMGPLKGKTNIGFMGYLKGIGQSFTHKDTQHTLLEAAKVTVMLLFIISNALLFAHVLTEQRIPQMMAEGIINAGLPAWAFLIVVNILLLLAGQFMEPSGVLLIMAPLMFPIAINLGIDPIHLGIIMVVNMEIGMITPPVGLNLFVTSSITKMPIMQVVRAAMPWLIILLVFLIMVTYIPAMSTLLPNFFMGPEVIIK